jgi:hypothetical protein
MDWRGAVVRMTFVLLAASLVLVGAGLAGFGSSLGLVVAVLGVAVALFGLRTRVPDGPTILDRELGAYVRVLWVGPTLAAAVCLAFLGATPPELQALGGLVGLLGMTNYFLRPVYRLGSALLGHVTGTR